MTDHVPDCWAIASDFNLTRDSSENNHGNTNVSLSSAFNSTIERLNLFDLPLVDRLFTWSNHRSTPTLARLDCVLLSLHMSHTFLDSSMSSFPKPTSYHTPILLRMSTSIPKANLFRFETAWDYLPIILPAWAPSSERGVAAMMVSSLKVIRCMSKAWARREHLLRRDCQDRLTLTVRERTAY